jgi:hypothetical protein
VAPSRRVSTRHNSNLGLALISVVCDGQDMGMFDYFVPDPPIACPKCGKALSGWQGKNDPAPALFVWKQGVAAPIDQLVDEECRALQESIPTFRLPDGEIWIYGGECECGFVADGDFRGSVENGVWKQLDRSIETARRNKLRRIEKNQIRRST